MEEDKGGGEERRHFPARAGTKGKPVQEVKGIMVSLDDLGKRKFK